MSESKKLNLKALKKTKETTEIDTLEKKDITKTINDNENEIKKDIKIEEENEKTKPIKQENIQNDENNQEKKKSNEKQKFLVSLDDIQTMKEKETKKDERIEGKSKETKPIKQENIQNDENNQEKKKSSEKQDTLFKNYSTDLKEIEKQDEKSKNNTKENKKEKKKFPKKKFFISLALLSTLFLWLFYIIWYKKMDFNTIKSNILWTNTKEIETNTWVIKENDVKTRNEIIKERIRQFLIENYKK